MTIPKYIELKKRSLEQYESKVRSHLKSSDAISVVIVAAALEAFSDGFDCAAESLELTIHLPKATK